MATLKDVIIELRTIYNNQAMMNQACRELMKDDLSLKGQRLMHTALEVNSSSLRLLDKLLDKANQQ